MKREEIYANQHQYLDHLRSNIEEFIERYWKLWKFNLSHVKGSLNKRCEVLYPVPLV